MGVQDLTSRIETVRGKLQEARNQMPSGEHRDVGITRHQHIVSNLVPHIE